MPSCCDSTALDGNATALMIAVDDIPRQISQVIR
jgi:hypothetical protein